MRWLAPGLAMLVLGCGQAPPSGPRIVTRAVSSEPVLASVNGSPIFASDLAPQLRAGRTPAQAVRELIELELLAQEAARRGLDRSPKVAETQRKAMVELLVRRDFRDALGPARIPRQLVERSYQANRHRFVHPELVEVSHFLARAGKKDGAARHEAARRLAERARALATASRMTPEEFVELEKRLAPDAGEVTIRVETLTTPLEGFTVKPFAEAAFALPRPGAVSPVVATQYGYHVIYLRARKPAVDRSFEEAEPELRVKILDEARTELLGSFIQQLEKKSRVRLLPENLPGAHGEVRR